MIDLLFLILPPFDNGGGGRTSSKGKAGKLNLLNSVLPRFNYSVNAYSLIVKCG